MEKEIIPPGDSAMLEVYFQTGHYRGLITKRPTIETNEDSSEAMHFVQVTSNVFTNPDSTYPLLIRPYMFDMSSLENNLRDSMEFELCNLSDHALAPRIIEAPFDMIDFDIPDTVYPGAIGKGSLHIKSHAALLRFTTQIIIGLDDEAGTRYTIPIIRNIIRALRPSVRSDKFLENDSSVDNCDRVILTPIGT